MKKVFAIVLLALAIMTFGLSAPAVAGDTASGAQIFGTNCAACHLGGGNAVNPQKTLQKEVLAKYEMNSLDAIKAQVTNGKNAMPSFKGRLNSAQIEDVASYVLDQSAKGW